LVAYAGRDALTGKRRYVSRAFRGTKREAQAALDRLAVEVDDGVEGGSVGTVGELLDRYVEVFGPTWSPSTLRQTVSAIERHLRPRWGQVQLRRVTPVDIDRFYAELRRRGGQGGKPLAGATVTRIHSILGASLEQGARWGLLGHNPALRASPPRGGEHEVRPPSPAELGRLLDAAAEATSSSGPTCAWPHRRGLAGARSAGCAGATSTSTWAWQRSPVPSSTASTAWW